MTAIAASRMHVPHAATRVRCMTRRCDSIMQMLPSIHHPPAAAPPACGPVAPAGKQEGSASTHASGWVLPTAVPHQIPTDVCRISQPHTPPVPIHSHTLGCAAGGCGAAAAVGAQQDTRAGRAAGRVQGDGAQSVQ